MALPPAHAFDTPGDAWPRPHDNCYWLVPGSLLAGEHPGSQGHVWLEQAGISACVDLTQLDEPVPRYRVPDLPHRPGVHCRHPIVDFGIPDIDLLHATEASVERLLQQGHRVYLHCRAGVGRTGTIAACLMVSAGLDASSALALLDRKWRVVGQRDASPMSPETPEQRLCVAAWHAHLVASLAHPTFRARAQAPE